MDLRITCIEKTGHSTSHEHISSVGNPTDRWKLSTPDTVRRIESKTDTFYVVDPKTGKRANVGVVRETNKAPYLRTYADGIWTDNLLSLTFCPF